MGKSKVRTLLMASVMIMLCAAMIVGGTYSLWSASETVNTHLSAGTLNVTLTRTYLKTCTLGADGYMVTNEDGASTIGNYFGMDENELIVPTSSYSTRLKLTNSGDVAIKYDIKIVAKNDSENEEYNAELAKQVKVRIGQINGDEVIYGEWGYLATVSDNNVTYTEFKVATGSMAVDSSAEVWVEIVFDDLETNNLAKGQTACFDLLVEAVQDTGLHSSAE